MPNKATNSNPLSNRCESTHPNPAHPKFEYRCIKSKGHEKSPSKTIAEHVDAKAYPPFRWRTEVNV